MSWTYEKLNDDYKVKDCPLNDLDGKITGKKIWGLKLWFDEHEDERKALGWVKHIHHSRK